MKPTTRYLADMLDLDSPLAGDDVLFRGGRATSARQQGGDVIVTVPFTPQQKGKTLPQPDASVQNHDLLVRAYGDCITRLTFSPSGANPIDPSPMLQWDPSLKPEPLRIEQDEDHIRLVDSSGKLRARFPLKDPPIQKWSELMSPAPSAFAADIIPDGANEVEVMRWDSFYAGSDQSLSLAYVQREQSFRLAWSLHAAPDEKFAGTGERFSRMDLAGQTILLENADAVGVNNRRAYKNVPFYLTSRGYGLFIHTPSHARLSLGDVSTRAAQGMVEDSCLDLFFIAGSSPERILYNYRRLTGFPPAVPLWTYGVWMSRMSYWTAEETLQVAQKMREGHFPCDVIHLDTGWFQRDWNCDWKFSPEKYPDPAAYFKQMRDRGFRISLWQMPKVGKETCHFQLASERGYIPPIKQGGVQSASNFSADKQFAGDIDFTNPQAVEWYQGLLADLLRLGAAAIKTDFGEEIDLSADFMNMPAEKLHNVYAILYQRAAFEITQQVRGEGVVWARAGWAGAQRYPIHWGGDCGCTYDGLAGTIRGGLHLGLSGYGFWSHDVPGFHGVPDFMNNRPSDDLYVRWTQVGVFTSHMRYHGTSPREPYEYPAIAAIVRKWLNLRYALIPYLLQQQQVVQTTGYPVLRSMLLQHPVDPFCWGIDDQFFLGDALLVAPILNAEGTRAIYLPAGRWVDLWTGEQRQGPALLPAQHYPLERMPVFAVAGSTIRVYPEIVQCTDEMDLSKAVDLVFDASFKGLEQSVLAQAFA